MVYRLVISAAFACLITQSLALGSGPKGVDPNCSIQQTSQWVWSEWAQQLAKRFDKIDPSIISFLDEALHSSSPIKDTVAWQVAYDIHKRDLTGVEEPSFLDALKKHLNENRNSFDREAHKLTVRLFGRKRVGLLEYEPSPHERHAIFMDAINGKSLSADPKTRKHQLLSIVGNLDSAKKCVNDASGYLALSKHLSFAAKIALWEELAELLHEYYGSGWTFFRREGTQGAAIYQGAAGHAIIIKPDGRIYRGHLPVLSENQIWDEGQPPDPDYPVWYFDPDMFQVPPAQ